MSNSRKIWRRFSSALPLRITHNASMNSRKSTLPSRLVSYMRQMCSARPAVSASGRASDSMARKPEGSMAPEGWCARNLAYCFSTALRSRPVFDVMNDTSSSLNCFKFDFLRLNRRVTIFTRLCLLPYDFCEVELVML